MKALYIAIIICFSHLTCSAAFPVKQQDKILVATATQQHITQPHLTEPDKSGPEQNGTFGVVAAILGGVSLLTTTLGLAVMNAPEFLIPIGVLTGIGAIIFGKIGAERKNEGWAKAGLVAGIISVGAIVALFLLALFIVAIALG